MGDMRAVCVTGWANSGKTTLIERLLPVFAQMGLNVGVIKHTHHDVCMDEPGTDTSRYALAGAQRVILAGPTQAYLHLQGEKRLTELLEHMKSADLVLVEGFDKEACLPMIEVWRDQTLPMRSPEKWRCAVVTEGEYAGDLPAFAPQNVMEIAKFILSL